MLSPFRGSRGCRCAEQETPRRECSSSDAECRGRGALPGSTAEPRRSGRGAGGTGCHGEDWKLDLSEASPSPRSVCQVRTLRSRSARGRGLHVRARRPGTPALPGRLGLPRLPAGPSAGSAWLGGGGVGGERRSPSGAPSAPPAPRGRRASVSAAAGALTLEKLSNSTGLSREAAFPLPRCAPVQATRRGSSNPPRAAAGQDVSSGKAKAPPSLRPCSKCSQGSGGASPGLCTRGARSRR